MREEILRLAQQAIKDSVFPGGIVGFVLKDGTREIIPFGNFTYEEGSPLVREDSIYDVASITKAIPTSSLALKLIDEGRLKITDKLIDYIPEFRNNDREDVLIKHLLTYTLDGYGLASLGDVSPEEMKEHILTHNFDRKPGTVFKYTNIPAYLLGLVVEKISGEKLDHLADATFFKPLGMERTSFHPQLFKREEIAPTEIDSRGLVHGLVHDESAHLFKTKGDEVVGHAGLFSTAPDILTFLEMLLHEGELHGHRYFSPDIISLMSTNQIEELGDSTGLGWELNQPRFMGTFARPTAFGKTGFTGTLCVADVARGVAYVILTNRTYPKRSPDSTLINAFRSDIGTVINSFLVHNSPQ